MYGYNPFLGVVRMVFQDTLVIIKPDAVRRRMIGQIVSAVENLGLSIIELFQKKLSLVEAENLYSEHKGKWHFVRNIKHMTNGNSVIIHVYGDDSVVKCRQIVESTREAYHEWIKLPENLIHSTSDENNVKKELESVGCKIEYSRTEI